MNERKQKLSERLELKMGDGSVGYAMRAKDALEAVCALEAENERVRKETFEELRDGILAQANKQRDEARLNATDANEMCTRLRRERDDACAEIERLRGAPVLDMLSDRDIEIHALRAEVEALRLKESKAYGLTAQELAELCDNTVIERDTAIRERDEARAERDRARVDPDNVHAGYVEACDERDEARAQVTVLRRGTWIDDHELACAERDALRAEVETLRRELKRKNGDCQELHSLKCDAIRERDEARATLHDWKASVDYANAQRDAALAKLERVRELVDDYKNRPGMSRFKDVMPQFLEILDADPDSADARKTPFNAYVNARLDASPEAQTAYEETKRELDTERDYDVVEREVVLWRDNQHVEHVSMLDAWDGAIKNGFGTKIARATVIFKVPRPTKKTLTERLEYLLRTGKQMPGTDPTLVEEVRALESKMSK